MEVHRILGPGFLESVYRAALKRELERRPVPTALEVPFRVQYKDEVLPVLFRADLVCFDRVVVEVKASTGLGRADFAQAINYLRVSSLQKALLLKISAFPACSMSGSFCEAPEGSSGSICGNL
jgi:GxxExxY protein